MTSVYSSSKTTMEQLAPASLTKLSASLSPRRGLALILLAFIF